MNLKASRLKGRQAIKDRRCLWRTSQSGRDAGLARIRCDV